MATKNNENTGRPWIKVGNEYHQMAPTSELCNALPLGVYNAKQDLRTREIYLEKIDDRFTFGYELYDIDNFFIEHVLRTFHSTSNNMGILLNGTKGTGKTVCAKIIANEMGLPVILCNEPSEELIPFIAQFNVPAIFFFDEFEKKFEKKTFILLSAMDGAYNTDTRKIFLLTTNQLNIDPNFINRPSRIRYRRTFGNISERTITEYCEKNLHDKKFIPEIINYIDSLKISTIDILKTLVEEINIHKCSIATFKSFFNVDQEEFKYTCVAKATNDPSYDIEQFKLEVNDYLKSDECKNNRLKNRMGMIKVTSETPVFNLVEGDNFYDGIILEPINKDGIMVIDEVWEDDIFYTGESDCQCKMYIKILNTNSKPSLYKHGTKPENLQSIKYNARQRSYYV